MWRTGYQRRASSSVKSIVKKRVIKSFPTILCILLMAISSEVEPFDPVLRDPHVPDGEQIVWRVTTRDREPIFSTVTWRVSDIDGKPVYEITTDSGRRKQAKYVIDKCDLRLVYSLILRHTEEGESEVTIEVRDGHQYLVHDFRNKRQDKRIKHHPDGYNGMILAFSLRGFPFGRQDKVRLRVTPPFKPGTPLWIWKMWKSYARFLGEERISVPAGTFDCYKLEVRASGRLMKRFTSQYYFWFTAEPPHCFVKYQDKSGNSVTELMQIRPMAEK